MFAVWYNVDLLWQGSQDHDVLIVLVKPGFTSSALPYRYIGMAL